MADDGLGFHPEVASTLRNQVELEAVKANWDASSAYLQENLFW